MIKFLTQDIEKTNWKSTDSVINFYERYKVYLDNLDLIKDTDDLIQALDIKLTYLFALDEKKHYTKADKNLKDISNSLKNIQDTDSFNRIYERFLFISGVISYRLKKYDESSKMFNEIKIIDPDNDLYKKWISALADQSFYQKTKILGYIGFVCFVFFVFSDLLFTIDQDLKLRLELLFFIVMMFGFFGYKVRKLLIKPK